MEPDGKRDTRAIVRRCEAIAHEIKLVSDGGYGTDYFISAARSLLLDVLEEDNPQTWEELRQCVQRRHLARPSRDDGSLELIMFIGQDRRGPLPA